MLQYLSVARVRKVQLLLGHLLVLFKCNLCILHVFIFMRVNDDN